MEMGIVGGDLGEVWISWASERLGQDNGEGDMRSGSNPFGFMNSGR